MSRLIRRPGRAARRSAVLGVALAALAPVASSASPATAAAATVTCGSPSVPMYHVDGQGQLRRWSYASPLDGTSGWTQQMIGTGWGGLTLASGGQGVLYTIDGSGNLRWYQDNGYADSGPAAWTSATGTVIGTGWNAFTVVLADAQGVFYAVDQAGDLHWYRNLGTNGAASWDPNSGRVIGSGWNGVSKLFSGGSGVIFAVAGDGSLTWYRHLDPLGGTASWVNGGAGSTIGQGWSGFTNLGSLGGGVIFARDASGSLWWYRDQDPLGGTATWANGGAGTVEGTGWNDSQVVTDIAGCTAA